MKSQRPSPIVLVHGAWHGGWCWERVAPALQAAGHRVFTPTLTGLAERAGELTRTTGLRTHIADIGAVLEDHDLREVILVGHSYGGMVITGVAAALPARVSTLVYLDAFVPTHGQSLMDLLDIALAPEVAKAFKDGFRGAAKEGDSGLMQPIPAEVFNVAERNRAWVNRRCRPQALATFEMPVLLSGRQDAIGRRLYILADGWDPSPFRHFAAQVDGRPGWTVAKLPVSHDAMVDMPEELATLLLELA